MMTNRPTRDKLIQIVIGQSSNIKAEMLVSFSNEALEELAQLFLIKGSNHNHYINQQQNPLNNLKMPFFTNTDALGNLRIESPFRLTKDLDPKLIKERDLLAKLNDVSDSSAPYSKGASDSAMLSESPKPKIK
jgi:hypothetical protein